MKRTLYSFRFTNVEVIPFDFLHSPAQEGFINLFRRIGSILERVPIIKETSGSLVISARKELRAIGG